LFCDECKIRPAAVHMTKIVNNKKTQLSLCHECAKKYQQEFGFGLDTDFSIHKFLSGLLEADTVDADLGKGLQDTLRCEVCGEDYSCFQKSGRLGCAKCYDTFGANLEALLKRIQGSSTHLGKLPKKSGFDLRQKQQLKNLREKLQELIAAEEFEFAAKVRDDIKALEKTIEEGGSPGER
jgi:protein arginine kinase activator